MESMEMNERVMELYRRGVTAVCREARVSEYELVGGMTERCTDARYVLVSALSLYLTDTEIACMMGRTRQAVNHMKNSRKVVRKSVRTICEEVRKQLAND